MGADARQGKGARAGNESIRDRIKKGQPYIFVLHGCNVFVESGLRVLGCFGLVRVGLGLEGSGGVVLYRAV